MNKYDKLKLPPNGYSEQSKYTLKCHPPKNDLGQVFIVFQC